jgi:hypothetical protein
MPHTLSIHNKDACCMKQGLATEYKQLFMDGTNRQQTPIQNAIVRYLGESGYETISLDMAIIADNETAECLTGSIQKTFKYCKELLNTWRHVA